MKLSLRRLKNKLLSLFWCTRKPDNRKLGRTGETIACKYLKGHKYNIITRNYLTPIGEIDIIAEEDDSLVFVEVKMRQSDVYHQLDELINSRKRRRLTQLAQLYIISRNLHNRKVRFDVVVILIPAVCGKKTIRLVKNAFDAEI
jgi:putative endonuclease